jgi:signal transduction histidine kinase
MSWSLRRRLATTVVLASGGGLVVMALALYIGVHRAAWRMHDEALVTHARALAAIAERDGDSYEMVLPPQPADEPTAYIEVWKPDGTVLLRSDSLHGGDLPRGFADDADATFQDVALPDQRAGRAVALRFHARDESAPQPKPLLLVLAEGTKTIDSAIADLRTVFLGVGVLSLAVIAGATLWMLARGTRPLARWAKQIESIDDRQLACRFSLDGQPAELKVPIRKLNDLLARLESSFAREREFTANVSHELRTPLAAIRTLLEVTLLERRTASEYESGFREALTAVNQLGSLIENLLVLAQVDAGSVKVTKADIELRSLVDQSWAAYTRMAHDRGIQFRNLVAENATIRTDRDKLRIVLANLLANAAEYTEASGWIEVTNTRGVLEVSDSGPHIPEEDLERIFDRLWRGDRSRSGNGVHCGIGLALSRSLCGTLSMSLIACNASEGRVTFRIESSDSRG